MAATYESVAKEFPDLPKKRIEGIVAQRNSAPQREEERARKRAEDKAQAERNQRAREAARREQAIKKTEASKNELEKLRAQRHVRYGSATLTPEQEQYNKDLQTKIDAEKNRRRELAAQNKQAELAKAKAAYEARTPAYAKAIMPFDPRNPSHAKAHKIISSAEFEKKYGIPASDRLATFQEKAAPTKNLTSSLAAPPVAPTPAPSVTAPTPRFGQDFGFASPDQVGYVPTYPAFKKGGKVTAKKYAKGGKVSSAPKAAKASTASRRGDGIAQRGKTKGRMV